MNGTSTRRVVVEPGGAGVVAHVGLHALGRFADRVGLGDALSAAIPWSRGAVPAARPGQGPRPDGPDAGRRWGELCDIEHLRLQEDLFGWVPSDTTVFRTFHEITPQTRTGHRPKRWPRCGPRCGDAPRRRPVSAPVILDIDASLVEVHSEHKEGAAPTYKGGLWLPPDVLLRRRDRRGAVLACCGRATPGPTPSPTT